MADNDNSIVFFIQNITDETKKEYLKELKSIINKSKNIWKINELTKNVQLDDENISVENLKKCWINVIYSISQNTKFLSPESQSKQLISSLLNVLSGTIYRINHHSNLILSWYFQIMNWFNIVPDEVMSVKTSIHSTNFDEICEKIGIRNNFEEIDKEIYKKSAVTVVNGKKQVKPTRQSVEIVTSSFNKNKGHVNREELYQIFEMFQENFESYQQQFTLLDYKKDKESAKNFIEELKSLANSETEQITLWARSIELLVGYYQCGERASFKKLCVLSLIELIQFAIDRNLFKSKTQKEIINTIDFLNKIADEDILPIKTELLRKIMANFTNSNLVQNGENSKPIFTIDMNEHKNISNFHFTIMRHNDKVKNILSGWKARLRQWFKEPENWKIHIDDWQKMINHLQVKKAEGKSVLPDIKPEVLGENEQTRMKIHGSTEQKRIPLRKESNRNIGRVSVMLPRLNLEDDKNIKIPSYALPIFELLHTEETFCQQIKLVTYALSKIQKIVPDELAQGLSKYLVFVENPLRKLLKVEMIEDIKEIELVNKKVIDDIFNEATAIAGNSLLNPFRRSLMRDIKQKTINIIEKFCDSDPETKQKSIDSLKNLTKIDDYCWIYLSIYNESFQMVYKKDVNIKYLCETHFYVPRLENFINKLHLIFHSQFMLTRFAHASRLHDYYVKLLAFVKNDNHIKNSFVRSICESYLITPVQRIMRYSLMIGEFIKFLKIKGMTFDVLQQIQSTILANVKISNEMNKFIENNNTLFEGETGKRNSEVMKAARVIDEMSNLDDEKPTNAYRYYESPEKKSVSKKRQRCYSEFSYFKLPNQPEIDHSAQAMSLLLKSVDNPKNPDVRIGVKGVEL